MILCIDPGRRIGWALIDGYTIVDCGTVAGIDALPPAVAAFIEVPRVYPNVSKWKGDPQHIVRLAMLAQRIADHYVAYRMVEPREWRGMVPEGVLRSRTRSRLTPPERVNLLTGRVSVHAWDAIGIACWALERPILSI